MDALGTFETRFKAHQVMYKALLDQIQCFLNRNDPRLDEIPECYRHWLVENEETATADTVKQGIPSKILRLLFYELCTREQAEEKCDFQLLKSEYVH